MYRYIVNVFRGSEADNARSAAAVAAAEVARTAQQRKEEQRQRLLAERRFAYAAFIRNAALGKLLASLLPPAEDIPISSNTDCISDTTTTTPTITAIPAPQNDSTDVDAAMISEERSWSASGLLTSSVHDAIAAVPSTELECVLYDGLTPLLSRGTTIVAGRVLELLSEHESALAVDSTTESKRSLSKSGEQVVAIDATDQYRLPFLFVLLLLRRWRACLCALAADVFGKTPSAHTLSTLRAFSCVLRAFVAVTEVHTEEVRAYLDELQAAVMQCIEESLRCLDLLTRSHTSSTFSVAVDGNAVTSMAQATTTTTMDLTELGNNDKNTASTQRSTTAPSFTHTKRVAMGVVQVQVWRLLSLLLYWMHMLHGVPVPHLNVISVFLSTSTAALDPARCVKGEATRRQRVQNTEVATSFSGKIDELHRCTGLNNTALLRQTYVLPISATTAATTWLPLAVVGNSGPTATTAIGVTTTATRSSAAAPLSGALMSSVKVRELLLVLLQSASKGVISNLVPSSSHCMLHFKKFSSIEIDHDLGFVVVLVCRLLHYSFVTGASVSALPSATTVTAMAGPTTPSASASAAEQVGAVVNPLLGALSILLARFIAEEHVQDAGKAVQNTPASGMHDGDGTCHADSTEPFLSEPSTTSGKNTDLCNFEKSVNCQLASDLLVVPHPRHARLLGQLGCGILLLTTLLQQNAQSVLDSMDHSFFFDALVTALQAVGKRFAEPSRALPVDVFRRKEEAGRLGGEASQTWLEWVLAVNTFSRDGAVPCTPGHLASLNALLGTALLHPVDDYLVLLSEDPIVDEFLHAYLGLLTAGRRLRGGMTNTLAFRGAAVTNNVNLSTNQSLQFDRRALDTLDQLEKTLMNVFLTTCDVADAMPDAVSDDSADTQYFNDAESLSWAVHSGEGPDNTKENWQSEHNNWEKEEADTASPFPVRSCLYNLLLKHALWCLGMARMHHRGAPPQPLLLSPPTGAFSPSALAGNSVQQSALPHRRPVLSFTSPHPPLLSPPLGPLHSFASASSAGHLNSPFAIPAHSAAVDLAEVQDDPFLLFLVHHGLFRILLHDEHYASVFMVHLPREESRSAAAKNSMPYSEKKIRSERPGSWQRAYITLLLISNCLQLHPSGVFDTTVSGRRASASVSAVPESQVLSSNNTSTNLQQACFSREAQYVGAGALAPSEKLLAYETVVALVTVLRPPSCASSSSPSPAPSTQAAAAATVGNASAGADKVARVVTASMASRYGALWRNCLLALLTSGLGTTLSLEKGELAGSTCGATQPAEQGEEVPSAVAAAASSIVSEALVRCGGTEYLLQASLTSAVAAAVSGPQDVSFRWTMCVLRELLNDPQARVHMAASCAKPLLLGVLWQPLLRRGGQELLTLLLCQPLIYSFTEDVSNDSHEVAATAAAAFTGLRTASKAALNSSNSTTTTTATDAGSIADAIDMHTVPRHCRKLCEVLWCVLNECVNGPLPTHNAIAATYANGALATSAVAFPSVVTAGDTERESVLLATLAALANAFGALSNAEELLPLRTLQQGLFEASRESSMHVYALLLHRLAQSWTSRMSSPVTTTSSAASFALPSVDAPGSVRTLLTADDAVSPDKDDSMPPSTMRGTATGLAAFSDNSEGGTYTTRESVTLITKVLVGLVKANPTQREVLYRNTINEEALVDCIANAWTATAHRTASGTWRHSSETGKTDEEASDESAFVRLCSYLVYESIDALDAFLDGVLTNDLPTTPQHHTVPCAWSLQNPLLLAAMLKRFSSTSLTATQQHGLRQILRTLTHTVASCQTSLYLAASTSLHEMLHQLLPVVALLPPSSNASSDARMNGTASSASSSAAAAASTRLDAMLVRLLVMLAQFHIDVRQLKQLLMLVIHSQQLRERQALVPLVVQLLSAAAQTIPAPLPQVQNRSPPHFLTLHRGCGPTGFRAALPEFPLEGYSVSLYVRWEGEIGTTVATAEHEESVAGETVGQQATREHPHTGAACCACVFSLRTVDRTTVLALLVERHTGRLFVQYRSLQQQEVRVHVAAVLPSREWSQVIFSHRPAAFLATAAGGQLHLTVNDNDAVTVPQVAYPLMSRGYLYVGCLGHEVDRVSVAHAFYGQVSTVYFFPFVLQEREQRILKNAARGAEPAAWTATTSIHVTTPLTHPVALVGAAVAAAINSRWSGAGGYISTSGDTGGGFSSRVADSGTEQWLVDRATLRVDTRLSDHGHLYNLAAVLRGRSGRGSRLFAFEGTLVCSTQRVLDSMGLLGALPSVVMPLCTLLVNPTLPISFRGLVALAPNDREPPVLPSWVTVPSAHTGETYDAGTVDASNAAILWVLELIPALASNEAIRNEMVDSGLFVFFGQVLQLLGPSLQVVVPDALLQLIEALTPFPRLFEDALTNLFLSSEVIHAAPRVVQLTWVDVQLSFLRAHPEALSCLRSLGTSMFVAAEVLRVTSEEVEETGNEAASVERAQQHPSTSVSSSSPAVAGAASCTLRGLEHKWMSYFEALTTPSVTISEAQSLQCLVENLRWTCSKEAVQLRILRRVRHLVASTASPFFVQLLGRKNYAVTLIPYIKESPSEAVRVEALLQLLYVVFRSKRTQELMNPVLLASRDTVVHVVEEVSLSWLKDVLQPYPVNLSVYLALRCGLVGQFDVPELPTSYTPLDESHTLKFAAVLLPLLMLMKRSSDAKLKAYVLTDLAVLLKSDAQAWRRVITVRGWYVSLAGVFAGSCSTAEPSVSLSPNKVEMSSATAAAATDNITGERKAVTPNSNSELRAPLRSSGLLFTTTSMILSYTLFQALLHESFGATELALVAAYLREQRLHRLLNQVLCSIADRYRSRLLAQRSERMKFGTNTNNGECTESAAAAGGGCATSMLFETDGIHTSGGTGNIKPPSTAASNSSSPSTSLIGLNTPTALVNLCNFFRVVEIVLFYAATSAKCESVAAANVPALFSNTASLSSSSPLESFVLTLPSRGSYTEWEELTLLSVDANTTECACEGINSSDSSVSAAPTSAKVATTSPAATARTLDGVYYACEEDDPQGDVRRAILRSPDGRWLHLPLAAKCAELLCTHSALLHIGSNGNMTSISLSDGGGAKVGAAGGSSSPGDALLAAVMSAASGNGGIVNGSHHPSHVSSPVLKGGMLRLFGRLLQVICRMTLRSPSALESIIHLIDVFIARVDRSHHGGGFLLLKRAVNADEAHEHSPIAVSMTLVHDLHDLLLRRLHAAEYGGSPTYPNANAALVDRIKSLVEIFRLSFEQLPAFAATSALRSMRPRALWQQQTQLPRRRSEVNGDRAGALSPSSSSMRDITGEVFTSGISTLQWLCDHQANPRCTVEAFAEVASRADYNAFLERCLIAVEREQMTHKALAGELLQEQRWMQHRLRDLFCENSLSRRLVQDNIKVLMSSSGHLHKDGGLNAGAASATQGSENSSINADKSADTSFTSFFLPSAAKKVTAAARASTWTHFTTALRGTVWNLETSGPQEQHQQQRQNYMVKYVKLSSQEQQALVHRKLVFDRDDTCYKGVSMASYSSSTSRARENASVGNSCNLTTETITAFGGDGTEVATGVSGTGSFGRASQLRLRGGEAVLLQVPEDDDPAAEEDLLRLSADEEMRLHTAAPLNELPNCETTALDQLHRCPSAAATPGMATAACNPIIQSVLSVPCEVPYMMHCWSASFTVRGSEVFVLIDDENKAYNQVVSEDARPYLLRPLTFSFHLSYVTQIAPGRRFRMRRTALEVWTRDRRSYFINFADTQTMNAALQALRVGVAPWYPFVATSFPRSVTGMVTATVPSLIRQVAGGGSSRHTVYVLQENPRREPMRLRAMTLWRNRFLSNFDYLLVLNLLAGRTLNDMTQYPVFPWVLADYTSNELDLTNPGTFRDLSLPMGACGSEERRAMVRERYTEMKELGDVPSHYFTHYSSPAVTLYFLVRLPPYTTLSILLQGGHFDHADRMFHSVEASFKAVTTSTQDVRELIPELFYLPELCFNVNRVDFGHRQDRTRMDDLQLPPWAHNDPYTFTYRMREALESPYVSAHLHEWIDLIFGYKQRGKDAIDALNVFNWHSYEELDKNRGASTVDHQLLIDSLDNIGQTPIQLFRQPHQSRPLLEWADPLLLPTHVKVLPLRWGCVRVAKVAVLATDKVLVITGNGSAASLRMHLNLIRQSSIPAGASAVAAAPPTTTTSAATGPRGTTMSPPLAAVTGQPCCDSRSPVPQWGPSLLPERAMQLSHAGQPLPLAPGGVAAGVPTSACRASLGSAETGSFDVSEEYERRLAPIPAGIIPNNSPYADGSSTASSVALLCYDNEVFLVLGGLYDNSVMIRCLSGAAGDVCMRAHHGRVTFVVRTGDSRYLVTGAEDTTFAVWSCQLWPGRQQLEVELLFTIYGHEDLPSAADVSSTLDIVATASLDGVLMLHSLSTGILDRVIRHPHSAPIHRVLVQENCYIPNIVFLSNEDGCVHQYSINGALLRTFTPPGRVTAWAVTPCQYFLMACQPHPYVHECTATAAAGTTKKRGSRGAPGKKGDEPAPAAATTVPPARQAVATPCIAYVHSFFLEVVKTVPMPADRVVSSLSVHPLYPQVVVAGTENGQLLLLQSVIG